MGRLGFAVKVLGEGGLPSHDADRFLAGFGRLSERAPAMRS